MLMENEAAVKDFLEQISDLPECVRLYLKDFLYLTDYDLARVKREMAWICRNLKRGGLIQYLYLRVNYDENLQKSFCGVNEYDFYVYEWYGPLPQDELERLRVLTQSTLAILDKLVEDEPEEEKEVPDDDDFVEPLELLKESIEDDFTI
jgi:hypothetical protein